jgi:hypothetical protein
VACPAENNRLFNRFVLDQPYEEVALFFLLDFVDALLNEGTRCICDINGNPLIVLGKELISKLLHRGRVGRGEQEALIDLWQSGHDVPDVANEAHIEHPVRFIKDNLRYTAEVGIAMPGEVKKAAWSCNEDIDAIFQGADLLAHIDATINNQ